MVRFTGSIFSSLPLLIYVGLFVYSIWEYNGGYAPFVKTIKCKMYNTKNEHWYKLWTLGDNVVVSIPSSTVTSVSFWWGMLIWGKLCACDNGCMYDNSVLPAQFCTCENGYVYDNSLYFLLNFVVNLKLFKKIKSIRKQQHHIWPCRLPLYEPC